MKHHASSRFWALYQALPEEVRTFADKYYALLKDNPQHPSLHFKRIDELWSVRYQMTKSGRFPRGRA